MKIQFLIYFVCLNLYALPAQNKANNYESLGTILRLSLKNAPFPDSLRSKGHDYGGKHYDFKGHYDDSTALVFIPNYFKPSAKTDVVVHFHGWYNHVDSVVSYFKLIEQFHAARRNAILIIPQGPKDAPDSYGGKLEQNNGFQAFINDILLEINKNKTKRDPSVKVGKIVLSGHSGGYRVIAHILLHGGLPIDEVLLFDGLYGQLEKYGHWLTTTKGRFVHIYTSDGGTLEETEHLMLDLKGWQEPFAAVKESECTPSVLAKNRIVLIFSPLTHNDVIHVNSNFQKYLETSQVLKSKN